MSYSTRVYRQRNAHTFDNEANKEQSSFFSSAKESKGTKGNKPSFFKAKLSVGQANDKYEQEADAVASKVVDHRPGNAPVTQKKEISNIQRYATPVEEEKLSTNDERMKHDKEIQEKPELQTKCAECEKEEKEKNAPVQMKSNDGGGTASPKLSSKIESSSGKGNKLPQKTLSEMNRSFNADFSKVKIHTDSEAVGMNRELHAQAFTHGSDIYFNTGKFNTDTADGKRLLAHELTHVVQQGNSEIRRDPAPPLPKFDFPVSVGFFKNFDATYTPDFPGPQDGTLKIIHDIFIVFDKNIDDAKKEKFRTDFQKNIPELWQDKFFFELSDPDFTPYQAHLKLDIQFVDDAKDAHTIMEVKKFPKGFRPNVESREHPDFPTLSHVAHLDVGDPTTEENAKKNAGKSIVEPSLVQYVGNFDFDSSEINSDCEKGINKIEEHIDTLPEDGSSDEISISNQIDYIGRASPEGNKWYNLELSKKRALAVRNRIEKDKPKAKEMRRILSGEGAEKTANEAIKENYRRVNVLVFPMTPFSKLKNKEQNIAAHEFGHMIGFGDEYDEKGDKKFEKKVEGDRPSHYEDVKSIMGQEAADELTMNQSSSIMSMGNDIKKVIMLFF